ncbi:MAG TPA: CHASE2 domain-containing protein [Verrucomicrobiales bacterium]|nr:CHASE2 domain-containing protein [Verrucomicrobiales bacterium]
MKRRSERKGAMAEPYRGRAYRLVAPAAVMAVILAGLALDVFVPLENLLIDSRFRARASSDPPADERIHVVGIREEDIRTFGRWPWSRRIHGQLLTLLAEAPPSAVTFDFVFAEPENPVGQDLGAGEDPDQYFADAAAGLGCVVVGAWRNYAFQKGGHDSNPAGTGAGNRDEHGFTLPIRDVRSNKRTRLYSSEEATLPIRELAESAFIGYVDSPPDGDGVRRQIPMVVQIGGEVYPSLVTQTLMVYWGVGPGDVTVIPGEAIVFQTPEGEKRVPLGHRGELLLNWRSKQSFYGRWYGYGFLSSILVRHLRQGEPWPEQAAPVQGKILLVGQDAEGLTDFDPSPLHPVTPNVQVHAVALNSILREDYIWRPLLSWSVLVWFGFTWATLFALRDTPIGVAAGTPVLLAAVYVGLSYYLFGRWSIQLPLAWPLTGFLGVHVGDGLLRWRAERTARQEIRSVFSSYISKPVMERLLRHPENIRLGGERRAVAILFSDIRGFTTISEAMREEDLVIQLNEYFEKMVACIHRYEGTLHKYIGDAIMAVWGDVTNQTPEESVSNAVRAALEMARENAVLNAAWTQEGRPEFHTGIGINFGEVMVGNIGAEQRREFTVIGDAVNTSSRLEGLTKQYRVRVLIGEGVQRLLDPGFLTRSVGVIVVKGKKKPVRVFEALSAPDDPAAPKPAEWVAHYERAFALHLERRFAEAASLFEACLRENPQDYCASFYLKICRECLSHPPPADWNGVAIMDSK